ncbi:hypothetical protein, partial [Mycolicibacterium smegmatis]
DHSAKAADRLYTVKCEEPLNTPATCAYATTELFWLLIVSALSALWWRAGIVIFNKSVNPAMRPTVCLRYVCDVR